MRIRLVLAGMAAAGLMAFPAMAEDGQYAPQLTRILSEAADGTCLAAFMQPALLDACNGQIEGMAASLAALGAIETIILVSAEETPEGRVETYSVKYAGGRTLTWIIGHEEAGKFGVVGTGG